MVVDVADSVYPFPCAQPEGEGTVLCRAPEFVSSKPEWEAVLVELRDWGGHWFL